VSEDRAEDDSRKTPAGIPPAESTARLRPPSAPGAERRDPTPLRVVTGGADDGREPVLPERPPGLKNMTTSARRRLELALEHDESVRPPPPEDKPRPPGLKNMTPSARRRLELALEHDESIRPPKLEGRHSAPELAPKDAPRRRASVPGRIPFDDEAVATIRSLSRWVAFCGFITLAVGALTGLSYLTGPGSVAHVVVGILATALSVWLLAAGWRFHRVARETRQQHHLVSGLGLVRTAMLLKAILVFSAMVLGCFTFSIAVSLLLLL